MTVFRPCIDLHQGRVKQIVGGSLADNENTQLKTNFISEHSADWYARLYQQDMLRGGHIIKLGPGNDDAACDALTAWPDGMHLGGGIDYDNARRWLDAGAEKLIVTSYLFENNQFSLPRLQKLSSLIGADKLVVDLSCRKQGTQWFVSTNRWQTITDYAINAANLAAICGLCSEFLIHAADVEGKCDGIDSELVTLLGKICPIPCTYAGGAHALSDLQLVADLSNNNVDLTYGSALDIFGGTLVSYADCVAWNKSHT